MPGTGASTTLCLPLYLPGRPEMGENGVGASAGIGCGTLTSFSFAEGASGPGPIELIIFAYKKGERQCGPASLPGKS